MKLSFSISSKSSSSRPPTAKPPQSFNPINNLNHEETIHNESKPQFVTFFDPSQNPPSNSTSHPIIPPTPMKIKNLPFPAADEPPTESRFVLDTSNNSSEPGGYGLMLRSNVTEAKSQQGDAYMSEKRRFQELIKDLPDEELPDVPVDGFGAAILAGFGWVEGKPIGRNCKENPKVFEYKPRAGTEGFGYVPQAPDSRKKSRKVKDDHTDDRDRECEEMGRSRSNGEKRRKYDVAATAAEKSLVRWLRSHIRVRIISKKFGGGKMYLKKGEVVDVVGPTICDVRMDESGALLQGVEQEVLETALPKCGGAVIVLYGKYKGVYGSLVERDSGKGRAVVRDADSHALINVLLEQIAEYVGDPGYVGY